MIDREDEKWESLWIKGRRQGWWYVNDGAMKTKFITKKSPEKEVLKKYEIKNKLLQ